MSKPKLTPEEMALVYSKEYMDKLKTDPVTRLLHDLGDWETPAGMHRYRYTPPDRACSWCGQDSRAHAAASRAFKKQVAGIAPPTPKT